VIYLMISNMAIAAGAASESLFFKSIPWIVIGLLVGSLAVATYLRHARPDVYDRIGRTVFDEDGPGAAAEHDVQVELIRE
jgi:hypothetical protein